MMNTDNINLDWSMVPTTWHQCFCSECPKHDVCLHYFTGQQIPDGIVSGPAVYPNAYKGGNCAFFKEMRTIKAAYGFGPLYKDVKQKDYTVLRTKLKEYLGGHSAYYRYNRGEHLLTPEQQEWIIALFNQFGYTEDLAFENYMETLDFS